MIGTLIVLILLYKLFKVKNILEGLVAKMDKERFIELFLSKFNKKLENYKYKKTELIFNFEIINKDNPLYNKLTIFNKTHPIEPNKPLRIIVNRKDKIKSDFNDYITLSNRNSSQTFIIAINLRQENFYQTFLDSTNNTNATEIVFYSKDSNIPKNLSAGGLKIKNLETNHIPRIKRFYAINIDVNYVKLLYNHYASNKMEDNEQIINDIYINFIKDEKTIFGRVFEQKIEKVIEDFNDNELNFLEKFEKEILKKKVFPFIQANNNKIDSSLEEDIIKSYNNFLAKNKSIKSDIINKMDNICFFIKYSYNEPSNKDFKIIERIIFLKFLDEKSIGNVYAYIKLKKEIFKKPFEFTLKEKILISLNISLNINKNINAKLLKLYSLPKTSPYVQSEIFYRDIILNLTYNSSLYFFYLQLNSNWGFDIISSNSWFKIKKIPLIEIQNHLFSDFFPFFFVFNSISKVAFTNPQTLIKAFNENKEIGYLNIGNFAETESINNTVKLTLVKIHEESHCKYKGGFNMTNSGRYLLNYDLKFIDCHLDTIIFDITRKMSIKGDDIGEEGYAAEIYILGNYKTIDKLLKSKKKLNSLYNIRLFIGPNFDDLKKNILSIISGEDIMMLDENFDNSKDISKKKNNDKKGKNEKGKGLMEIFLESLEEGIY